MRKCGRRTAAWAVSLFSLILLLAPALSAVSQEKPETAAAAVAEEPAVPRAEQAPAETIHPGPQSLKETWSIGVFLAWMWSSIVVLLYLIRLQIKEADRVHEFGYHRPKGPPGGGRRL